MVGTRTRAKGASPGGFKTLDDIPKPKRGKGKAKAKTIKTESVETSIESESTDPFTTEAEGTNNTLSQKASSPATHTSRTESRSPSPTPAESRQDSRSTSPPLKNTLTSSFDAISDNDVLDQKQEALPIAPLGSNRKRSRVEESSTQQSVDSTNESAEEVLEQRSVKRARFSSQIVEVQAEAEESIDPEPAKKRRGRPTRNRTSPKKPATANRSRKQEPVVLNDSSSDEAVETVSSPLQPRSTSTPKQPTLSTPRTPQNEQEVSSAEDKLEFEPSIPGQFPSHLRFPPPDLRPTPQAEVQMPAASLAGIGPKIEQRRKLPTNPYALPNVTRAVSQSTIRLTPGMSKTDRLREIYFKKPSPGQSTSPTKGKEMSTDVTKESPKASRSTNDVCSIFQITKSCHDPNMIQVTQIEREKTTAVASTSENLSKSDISPTHQSPRDGLRLTDPYLVAVAKAFTNHKDKSKAMPSIEQVTAFLNGFDAQQPSYNAEARMIARKPAVPVEPKTPRRGGFVVPGWGSDDDSLMSDDDDDDDDAPEPAVEPKTPELPTKQTTATGQDASPRSSSWWNPIATVATMITSPFRKQSVDPAPLPRNKLVPPFIFNQPITTPSQAPLKRMSKSERKSNTGNKMPSRSTSGLHTERRPRHKNVEKTPVHLSGLLTPEEVREIHRAQDEYAAKHQNRGPLFVANRDIHQSARNSRRTAVVESVEEETRSSTSAKAGDKRDVKGAPKTPSKPKPWNAVLAEESPDEAEDEPQWIRCRNGLYIRSDSTRRQFEFGEIIPSDDPRYQDYYRDIDAFPKQNIYKPAGVQNPLNSAQLLQQARKRAQGVDGIPPESENDYDYVINPRQKKLLFYPRSPYNRFDIPGQKLTADHITNIKEGLPLLTPRDEFGIVIKVSTFDTSRPENRNKVNIFEQLHDWDQKQHEKEAADLKAGRILEPKQWDQTPPPKPKPGNAKLPGVVEKAPVSEAVQQAMDKANKYLPAKSSGLRNVATMSPLHAEQDKGRALNKHLEHPILDFSDDAISFICDPLVKESVLECLQGGKIPFTPVPHHIWNEHHDLKHGEVENAVFSLFEGLDARVYGSAHRGLMVEQ